jgi:hypothetical protein
MIIREHCRPGARANPDGWLPVSPWPADCMVQWGGAGLVLRPSGDYRTAFFEAFPREPDTFIRGEGADVPAAEAEAWRKFARQRDCPGHKVERAGYRNGAGVCSECGLFVSKAFAPLPDPDTSSLLGAALGGDPAALARVAKAIKPEDL